MKNIILFISVLIALYCSFMIGTLSVDQVSITTNDVNITTCDIDSIKNDLVNYQLKMQSIVREIEPVCDAQLVLPEDRDLFFQTITYNANARPYELDVYDCTEFSDNLADDLKELGWKAKTKVVNVDCDNWDFSESYTERDCRSSNGGHQIVQVDKIYIEATSGNIIPTWDYERYGLR